MIWTDQMQLTPERLNDLQKRADSQAFVIFDMSKGFWGSQIQQAVVNGKLILIKILYEEDIFTHYCFLSGYGHQNDYYYISFNDNGIITFKQAYDAENNTWQWVRPPGGDVV